MKKNYRGGNSPNNYSSFKSKVFKSGLLFTMLGLSLSSYAQTENQKAKITQHYNKTTLSTLQQKFHKRSLEQKSEAIAIAKRKGWDVIINLPNNKGFAELQRVTPDGKPVYYSISNVDAARSTRTNHINSGGSLGLNLDGQNMTAHVWDGGGTRPTHQEFDGPGGNNRVTIIDGSTLNGNSFHAQHVTGTIMASGVQPNAKGMASHAKARTSDWTNDLAEATTEAANGMLISNHSYGFAFRNPNTGQVQLPQYYFGGYIDESRNWDELMFNTPNYLMVVAAGNDGNDNSANQNPTGGFGYDKLTGHSTSKNNLVVANAQDANVDANGNLISVAINSSSSEGPTDDFRIKPDITGNGTGVYSTYDNSDTAYNSISGTSMASPNVTGSLLLLQQHYNNLNNTFMRAATLKGIALHTASDAGANGPDAVFGWGLLNAKLAAETITNRGDESRIEELTLTAGQTYTITVDSDGSSPLMASISWTDRPGTAVTSVNSTTPVLVNDLDIRVSQGGTTHLPYKLTAPLTSTQADNNVDPYERIDIANASGTYTITVTHKGSLTGGSQDFSLIVTGVSGTPVVCNATTPTGISTSNITSNSAEVNWTAVPQATYDVRYRKTGTSSWTTTAVSDATIALSGLDANTTYEVQVRSKCTDANSSYSASVNFTTEEIPTISCSTTITAFPYAEGFESGDGWAQITGDDGNWVRRSGSTPSSGTGPSSAAQGSSYLFLEASTNGSSGQIGHNATAILESDCIDLTGKSSATFSFENHMYGNNVGSLKIQGSSDGTSWTDLWSASGNKGNQWNSDSVDLNAYLGLVMKLRIVGTTGNGWSSDIAVDDLSITVVDDGADTQAPSTPSNLTASNVTQTTATLSWSASTDNVGVTGYEVFNGGTSVGTVTGTSINLTGLTAGTSYTYTVRAQDAAGNNSAAASITFTTTQDQVDYCTSSGNRTTYEWIDYVAFGGMTNSTGANGGYGDFTNLIATVARGTTNQLTVSAGFRSTAYTEYWKVWIDYNQNGTFEASEEVTDGSSSSAANLTADIAIPTSALTGQTRMRVSMKYNAAPTACENFGDGEVEDYTVNITNTTNAITTSDTTTNGDSIALGHEGTSFGFTLYPNPTPNNTITINVIGAKDVSYAIKNMLGQTVKAAAVTTSAINIGDLQTGLYIVEVTDGQKSITKKLIKQ